MSEGAEYQFVDREPDEPRSSFMKFGKEGQDDISLKVVFEFEGDWKTMYPNWEAAEDSEAVRDEVAYLLSSLIASQFRQ